MDQRGKQFVFGVADRNARRADRRRRDGLSRRQQQIDLGDERRIDLGPECRTGSGGKDRRCCRHRTRCVQQGSDIVAIADRAIREPA